MSYTGRDRDRGRIAVAAVTGIGAVGALTATGWLTGVAASDLADQQASSAGAGGPRTNVRDLRQRAYVTRAPRVRSRSSARRRTVPGARAGAQRAARPAGAGGRLPRLVGHLGTVASLRLSVQGMRVLGTPLGAGVLLSLDAGDCPVDLTRRVVRYLAGQSAGRCGPCFNGLPALAAAVDAVGAGLGGTERVEELARLVVRRGACAHPDGTVRLVRSMLGTFAAEVVAHAAGACRWAAEDQAESWRVAGAVA
jgi:hypothetical protein